MTLTINTDILKKHNISLEEFLVLYLGSSQTNVEKCISSLVEKNLGGKSTRPDILIAVSDNVKNLLATIIVDSDKKVINKEAEFLQLANKMRDLYPSGKKPGTTYMWRDSAAIIAHKLKTVVTKFNFHFTERQALEATKKYIASFNGNYQYMHLLKYFILKKDIGGELKSEFMSLIDNEDNQDITENDFVKMR